MRQNKEIETIGRSEKRPSQATGYERFSLKRSWSNVASELFMIEALMQDYLARLGHLAGFLVISMLMVSCPAHADKIKHPVAVFAGLDKITGRTIAFQAAPSKAS